MKQPDQGEVNRRFYDIMNDTFSEGEIHRYGALLKGKEPYSPRHLIEPDKGPTPKGVWRMIAGVAVSSLLTIGWVIPKGEPTFVGTEAFTAEAGGNPEVQVCQTALGIAEKHKLNTALLGNCHPKDTDMLTRLREFYPDTILSIGHVYDVSVTETPPYMFFNRSLTISVEPHKQT